MKRQKGRRGRWEKSRHRCSHVYSSPNGIVLLHQQRRVYLGGIPGAHVIQRTRPSTGIICCSLICFTIWSLIWSLFYLITQPTLFQPSHHYLLLGDSEDHSDFLLLIQMIVYTIAPAPSNHQVSPVKSRLLLGVTHRRFDFAAARFISILFTQRRQQQ